MNSEEAKQKAKELILAHLKAKGYPDITDQQIINELKPIWIKLEEAGLTLGTNFQSFCNSAIVKQREVAFAEIFSQQFNSRNRR